MKKAIKIILTFTAIHFVLPSEAQSELDSISLDTTTSVAKDSIELINAVDSLEADGEVLGDTLIPSDSVIMESTAIDSAQTPSEPKTIMEEETAEEIIDSNAYMPVPNRTFAPMITFGFGTINYLGELSKGLSFNSPSTGNYVLKFGVSERFTPFLEGALYGFYGTTSANYRSSTKNLNFSTLLIGGGFNVQYNFDNFLPENRTAEPFIGVGLEFFEFNSSTDLYDEFGSEYHYWSDGRIMNQPENINNDQAVRLNRDYVYESDLREHTKVENDGYYNNYTLAVPVSAGANLWVEEKFKMQVGVTYHFTFTDYIDGMAPSTTGEYEGTDGNDNFLEAYATFSYHFQKEAPELITYGDWEKMRAIEMSDNDEDGILDFLDDCLYTPLGIEVDSTGCAIDTDDDLIPDYKDKEINSAPDAPVDSFGITYTDDRLALLAAMFADTTGRYSRIQAEENTTTVVGQKTNRRKVVQNTYAVKIGEFEDEIPTEYINTLLLLDDVQIIKDTNGTTTVIVGNFNSLPEAFQYKLAMEDKEGQLGVVSMDKYKHLESVDGQIAHFNEGDWPTQEQVYRIQLGAYAGPVADFIYSDLPNVVSITSDDGVTRYYSGAYSSYEAAVKAKIGLEEQGLESPFIVALENGRRISLTEAGVTFVEGAEDPTPTISEEDKAKVNFHVQIGSFKNQIPVELLNQYMELTDVESFVGNDGINRYVAGSFKSYAEVKAYRKQLLDMGYEGAFIVASLNGELVPAKIALDWLNE